jgi:hypothetical protein
MKFTNYRQLGLATFVLATVALIGSYYFRSFASLLAATGFIFIFAALFINILRPTLIVLVSIVFSMAAADFFLGWLYFEEPLSYYDPKSDYVGGGIGTKTDLGFQPKKGIYKIKKFSADGEVIFDVMYTIEEDQFRLTKTEGKPSNRVNFFGCSFTFGDGLNDDETLPYLFSKLSDSVLVKNFGYGGYGPHQAVSILLSDRDTTGKINFFLTAPWQAPRSACKQAWTVGSPKYETVGNQTLLIGKCREDHINAGLIKRVIRNSNIYELFVRSQNLAAASDEDYKLYLELISTMHSISKSRGQKFVVGFVKAKESYFYGSSFTNLRIFEALKDRSDLLIDLTLADSTESIPREYYIHPLDEHPSAKANHERARKIFNSIREHF